MGGDKAAQEAAINPSIRELEHETHACSWALTMSRNGTLPGKPTRSTDASRSSIIDRFIGTTQPECEARIAARNRESANITRHASREKRDRFFLFR